MNKTQLQETLNQIDSDVKERLQQVSSRTLTKLREIAPDIADSLKNDTYIKALLMNERSVEYLKFHHESIFKGSYDFFYTTENQYSIMGTNELMVAENECKYRPMSK